MKYSLGISNFFEESLVFPMLLFSSISLHWSLRKSFLSLFAIFWNSAFKWVYLSFSPLPFPFRFARWQSRRTCVHLLLQELQNYNLLLNNCWQERYFHQKDTHVQGQRRSPSKMVGGVKFSLKSNPIPGRDTRMAQTKPCAHQKTPQRLNQSCLWMFECLLQWYRSAVVCHRGKGSGCSRPGYGINPVGGGHH